MTTSPVRTIIADDERPARDRLQRLLARDDRVRVLRSCADGPEVIETIRSAALAGAPIQLLFLDIQMPEVDGFGVLAALRDERLTPPEVVFVTAYDEYALRAFEAQAVDYLLKPFSDERFHAALDRALRHVRSHDAGRVVSQIQSLLDGRSQTPPAAAEARAIDRLVVRGAGRVRLVPVDQISWIKAEGMYVRVHLRDGAALLHRALLGSLERTLDPHRFVRIHRSAMVNIDLVAELRQDAHGDHVALLRDRTEVRVGRGFRDRLEARLGQRF